MKKAINYLRGTVRVSVCGPFPERVLNLCAQNGVDFWAVDWKEEHTLTMTVRRQGMKELERLAGRVECQATVLWRWGLPEILGRFRRRFGFLIGLGLSLCAVMLLSQFVLRIEVSGNERVPTTVILQQLQRFGVCPGAYGPGLDRRQIEQEILLELGDLSWMTLNLRGTHLDVVVREREKAPDPVDETGCYHVVAKTDGIIEQIEPELGDALVGEGDIVAKGEMLISGTVTLEPPLYSDLPERYYPVHARGRVWARTWRELTAVIPETVKVKRHTGREKQVWAINFFGRRIEIFGNSSILDGFYDKITNVCQCAAPGGEMLPLWLTREVYREYEPGDLCVERDAACALLENQLTGMLERLVGETGAVYETSAASRIADGLIRVTVTGECREEIGLEIADQHQ